MLGFCTLSAAQAEASQLSPADQKKLPRYPVPCFRLGRLARDLKRRGVGVGEILIGLAVKHCRKAQQSIGAYALLVDAKNTAAKSSYEPYGFVPFLDNPTTLFMPIR